MPEKSRTLQPFGMFYKHFEWHSGCPVLLRQREVMRHHIIHITSAKPQWDEESDILVDEEIGSGLEARIIVWNDDVNTFDWVIECFMEILGHTSEQSEQLAIIIHTKGKAIVKTGTVEDLRPKCEALQDRGLSAELNIEGKE